MKLTGKNLWDKEKAQNLDNWVPSTSQVSYSDFAIEVEAGSKITISTNEIKPLGLYYYLGIVLKENGPITNWLYHSTAESLIHEEVTVTSLSNKIWIRCAKTTILNDFLPNNPYFQVEYGEEKTAYEPYRTPQTVTLTADRPLTKWDKLEKRNGQWGWVYKSAEIVLDGSEDWVLAQTDNYNQFYINIDDTINSTKNVYCEKFRSALIADRETEKEIIYTVLVPGNFGGIAVSTDLATEVDAWKTWLQSNAIRALYKSTEETVVPLSEIEQEAMNELYTFRPTTVLSNDQECEMTLTYKTKKDAKNLLDYKKLINPEKWIPVGSAYRHFDISLKPKTTYKLSVSANNMYKGYKKDYDNGKFAFYIGDMPDSASNNAMFGNTNVGSVLTERTFTTSENPFYLNLYVATWNSEQLHIVFDELLPNIKIEEVTT